MPRVKVQTLVCLGKLMPSLEPWMITEQIIPTLPKINSKEPGILMAILGIYKLATEMEHSALSREQMAKSVLPFLMATSVENTLNLSQFDQYIGLIKKMLAKVETEQRSRLQQLSASQEEQRSVKDFISVLEQRDAAKVVERNFDGLIDIPNAASNHYGGSTQTNGAIKNTGPLSLEEKKRLAAEQEANLALRSQTSLLNSKSSNSSAPSFNDMMRNMNQKPSASASDRDLSAFLPPPPSSIPAVRPSSTSRCVGDTLGLPQTAAFNAAPSSSLTGLDDLFSNSKISGPVPRKLVQSPSVSNPINRLPTSKPAANKMDLSAFDSLIAFPSASTNRPVTRTPVVPSMNDVLRPTPKQKDPFDDLLG